MARIIDKQLKKLRTIENLLWDPLRIQDKEPAEPVHSEIFYSEDTLHLQYLPHRCRSHRSYQHN